MAPFRLFPYTGVMDIVKIFTDAVQGIFNLVGQAFGLVAQFFELLGSIMQQLGGLFGG